MRNQKYWTYTAEEHRTMQRIFKHRHKRTQSLTRALEVTSTENIAETIKAAQKPKIEHVTGEVIPTPKAERGKKRDYFISYYDKKAGHTVKKVSGVIYNIDGLYFGLNRADKKHYYTVTDILTGFMVGECETQKRIYAAVTPELITKIQDKHRDKDIQPYISRIKAAYTDANLQYC